MLNNIVHVYHINEEKKTTFFIRLLVHILSFKIKLNIFVHIFSTLIIIQKYNSQNSAYFTNCFN